MTDPPIENQKQIIQNPDDSATGLPLLITWPAVYAFVLITFILIVLLLTWFTEAYS